MAFEEGPRFEGQQVVTPFSWRNWIARHRHWLIMLAGLFLLTYLLVAAWLFSPSEQRLPPGGLDGCLASADGRPLQAVVRVGEYKRTTYADGCFFFQALAPGSQVLIVETASGQVFTQTIQVISGQALTLGRITPP